MILNFVRSLVLDRLSRRKPLDVAVCTIARHYEVQGQSDYTGLTVSGSGRDIGAGVGVGGLKTKSRVPEWMTVNVVGYKYNPKEAVKALRAFKFWMDLTNPPKLAAEITMENCKENFIPPPDTMNVPIKFYTTLPVTTPMKQNKVTTETVQKSSSPTEEEVIFKKRREEEVAKNKVVMP